MTTRPTHFVLDAETVIAQGFGASAGISALLSAASAVGYKIYLPKVALEEIVAKYTREIEEIERRLSKDLPRMSRLLGRGVGSSLEGFDLQSETKSFKKRLLDQLKWAEAVIVNYPCTSHESLAKRATLRKRPFDDSGSGYRDALIWETVLNLSARIEGSIIFVSRDKDFRGRDGKLHCDLVEDLEGLGLPKDKVTLVTDVATLVDQHLRPNLGIIPWEEPLAVLAKHGVNLADSVAMIIQDACSGEVWDPSELGLPEEFELPTLDAIHDVSDLRVMDLRQLPSNQILVNIKAEVYGEFDVFGYKPYLSSLEFADSYDLYVYDDDWDNEYALASVATQLQCTLDLILDASDPEKHSVENASVEFYSL